MPFWRSATSPELTPPGSSGSPPHAGTGQLPVTAGKRHLPQPRGPHSVGFVDVMTPGGPEKGSLVRILYPTKEQCLKEHERWPVWKEDKYITGMLSFMQAMLERWPSWAPKTEYLGIERMSYISPYIPHLGFPTLFRLLNGKVHVPIVRGALPDCGPDKWPLVVFSHGLGCARSTYSRVCYDLASYGFVVAAVEHRDGTACISFCEDPCAESKIRWIPHRRILQDEDEYAVRNSQVHHRAKEVSRALDLMLSMEKEGVPNNLLGSSNDILFSYISKATDVTKPIIAGHSFGGATTVLSLIEDSRFTLGIALDAWLFPLRDEQLQSKVAKPIMFISTDSFRSPENLAKISEIRGLETDDKLFCFIKGSVHQNHIDAPFVVNHSFVKRIIGMHSETCPETVIDINNKMMVQFMWKLLGKPPDCEVDQDLQKHRALIMNLF